MAKVNPGEKKKGPTVTKFSGGKVAKFSGKDSGLPQNNARGKVSQGNIGYTPKVNMGGDRNMDSRNGPMRVAKIGTATNERMPARVPGTKFKLSDNNS